jgi:hypothetical protein
MKRTYSWITFVIHEKLPPFSSDESAPVYRLIYCWTRLYGRKVLVGSTVSDAVVVAVGAPQHQPTNLSDSLSLAGSVMNPERLRKVTISGADNTTAHGQRELIHPRIR